MTPAERRALADAEVGKFEQQRRKRRKATGEHDRRYRSSLTKWRPGFVVDVTGLLDLCEALDPYDSYGDRREFLLESGGAA